MVCVSLGSDMKGGREHTPILLIYGICYVELRTIKSLCQGSNGWMAECLYVS